MTKTEYLEEIVRRWRDIPAYILKTHPSLKSLGKVVDCIESDMKTKKWKHKLYSESKWGMTK